jgi:hypothetical protein
MATSFIHMHTFYVSNRENCRPNRQCIPRRFVASQKQIHSITNFSLTFFVYLPCNSQFVSLCKSSLQCINLVKPLNSNLLCKWASVESSSFTMYCWILLVQFLPHLFFRLSLLVNIFVYIYCCTKSRIAWWLYLNIEAGNIKSACHLLCTYKGILSYKCAAIIFHILV